MKNAYKEEVKIERDILGTLLAEATQSGRVINIDKTLTYPRSPVCVPLCTADGSRRKTTKSDLFPAFENMEFGAGEAHNNCKRYLVDLAAYIRSTIMQCRTVRDIAVKLMKSVMKPFTLCAIPIRMIELNPLSVDHEEQEKGIY